MNKIWNAIWYKVYIYLISKLNIYSIYRLASQSSQYFFCQSTNQLIDVSAAFLASSNWQQNILGKHFVCFLCILWSTERKDWSKVHSEGGPSLLSVSASVVCFFLLFFPACSPLRCSSAPANDLASSGASIGRAADKIVGWGGRNITHHPPHPRAAAAGAMTQDQTETDGVESGTVLLQRPVRWNF